MSRRRAGALVGVAAVVGSLLAGTSMATAAPASAHICIPVIWPCDDPTPAPSDTPTPSVSATATPSPSASATADPGDDDGTGAKGDDSDAPKDDADAAPKTWSLIKDDDSQIFTQPPAQLGSDSLSFSGLKGIALVRLTLADGKKIAAIRLRADRITITGFSLTVRAATGPKLVTTADTMTLEGNVNVYVNSLTATTAGGKSYTLGADTPPPADGITPKLLRVTLGLVGSSADSITYTNTDQQMHE
ncbi:hypothetical protein PU630_15935 [Microbacterium horticulturae]|uniref:Uncharacterized protein n=1 Tax=Microbacterium horticulturae TaxID=3028316 RepID=A0ABY8BX28_9MICO|nr:hypothetical protein [Microbacterium sp. KACC 23027]WEG08714.1 hypothetical protein PU630_15935 [Microbacterium sp. KACC 23027]